MAAGAVEELVEVEEVEMMILDGVLLLEVAVEELQLVVVEALGTLVELVTNVLAVAVPFQFPKSVNFNTVGSS